MSGPYADRVKETATTTGTGNFTLAGAVAGFQSFNAAFGVDAFFNYTIVHGAEWETGRAYLSAPTTLVRDTVRASSNAGELVDFSAGAKDVFCSWSAYDANAAVEGGGGGGTFVPLTQAQRVSSMFDNTDLTDGAFVTIEDAVLIAGGAKAALILVIEATSFTGTGTVGDDGAFEYYTRPTGSDEIADVDTNTIYNVERRIMTTAYAIEHHQMITVACGVAGDDIGKFDVKWVDGAGANMDLSTVFVVMGYWT